MVVAAVVFLNGAACELGHSCTEVGCADSVSLRVTSPNQPWPDGVYQLEVALDDVTGGCAFTLPDDLPVSGSVTSIPCLEGAELGIQQRYECTTRREGDAVSQSCAPVPDRYELTLSAYATPEQLTLSLARDGTRILDETRELTYATTRPNGPDCSPECRQADVELTLD